MRLFTLLSSIALFLNISTMLSADTLNVSSKISAVTVYFEGARITRQAQLNLSAGRKVIRFENLPLSLDPDKVLADRIPGLKILAVNTQLSYPNTEQQKAQRKQLNKKVQDLEDEIALLRDKIRVYQAEEDLLIANRNFQTGEGASVQEIQEAANLYRTRLNELGQLRLDIKKELRLKQDELKKVYDDQNANDALSQLPKKEVLVTVDSERSLSGKLNLYYYVDLAAWKPAYDFRVENIQEPIEVVYNGLVYQSTGEDWTGIELTLSSANPTISGTAPTLNPWYINRGQTTTLQPTSSGIGGLRGRVLDAQTGEPMAGATVIVEQNGTVITGATCDFDGIYQIKPLKAGSYQVKTSFVGYQDVVSSTNIRNGQETELNINLQAESQLLESVVIADARYEDRASGSSSYKLRNAEVQKFNSRTKNYIYFNLAEDVSPASGMELSSTDLAYTIDEKLDIPSNGKDQLISIQEKSTEAIYLYKAVPKMNLNAFLIARLPKWSDLELLSAETNIYYQGTYLGTADLDTRRAVDTLEISLGKDESIRLERARNMEIDDKRIIGNNTKKTVGWDITIRNNKAFPIEVELYDQYPLSEYKAIQITQLGHGDAKLNEVTGELKWSLTIPGSKNEKRSFAYEVKYPSSGRFVD